MISRTLTPDENLAADNLDQDSPQDYEFVLGRRQMASLGFLGLVVLATAVGGSYLVGKASSTVHAAAPDVVEAATVPDAPPVTPDLSSEAAAAPEPVPAKPLFDQPIKGVIYIQMGALEKGIAEIFALGMRERGFDSFVASGPNDHIFRVLIGPFQTKEEFDQTQKRLDGMGLDTFARRYEE